MRGVLVVLVLSLVSSSAWAQSVTARGYTEDGRFVIDVKDPDGKTTDWGGSASFRAACVAVENSGPFDGCAVCADAASCALPARAKLPKAASKSPDRKHTFKLDKVCDGYECTLDLIVDGDSVGSHIHAKGGKVKATAHFRADSTAVAVVIKSSAMGENHDRVHVFPLGGAPEQSKGLTRAEIAAAFELVWPEMKKCTTSRVDLTAIVEPAGKVTVQGDERLGDARACVERAAAKLKVRAFEGPTLTVKRRFDNI